MTTINFQEDLLILTVDCYESDTDICFLHRLLIKAGYRYDTKIIRHAVRFEIHCTIENIAEAKRLVQIS